MNKKRAMVVAVSVAGVLTLSAVWLSKNPFQKVSRNLTDEALLALIKNDLGAFKDVIEAGGNVHDRLPAIDGKTYTIAEGISYFERTGFGEYLNQKQISYVDQKKDADFDIMTIGVSRNNPELFRQLMKEKITFDLGYGKKAYTLLHLASLQCSHKLTEMLHKDGKLSWDHKAKDGSTPLTLAAQNDCLPMLSYWKEQGADFRAKDGRGLTALNILKGKKDAALTAFAESFEERKIATVTIVKPAPLPNFYKKRKIPKEQIVDHAAMLEPEDRPLEATETAEFSEFAD